MEIESIWSVIGILGLFAILMIINFTSKKTKHDLPSEVGDLPFIDTNSNPFAPIDAEDDPKNQTR